MKKIIFLSISLLLSVIAFSQAIPIISLTYTNDSTATEIRDFSLVQAYLDYDKQTIVYRNRVITTVITSLDTLTFEKLVKFSIAKEDSVFFKDSYLKAKGIYNNFHVNGIDRVVKMNKALIFANPNKR